ncbi:MAG: glycosyltransferase [Fibrobacter sp.]|nr:glycosyltransferase [Fibrobacter sp.]
MKNVAIIASSLNSGGAERTAANISNFLVSNYNVHVILFNADEIKYPYSGKLHVLDVPSRKSLIGKILNLYKRVKCVAKIKRDEKIDVSISLMVGPNIVNVLTKKRELVISSIRNHMSLVRMNRLYSMIFGKILNYVCNNSDKTVCLSKGVERDLIEHFGAKPDKLITIYNPCDVNVLLNASSDYQQKIDMDEYSVTTMGRLTQQKGQWLLIRAFADVLKKIPNAKLYIFGEGTLENELKNLVRKLNIEKSVFFCGFVEAPHQFIKKSRLFVFSSMFEGLGNVLIEAMACGVPCISTDCLSGPREIIAPETEYVGLLDKPEYAKYGILVQTNNEQVIKYHEKLNNTEKQLSDTIVDLLQDKHLWQKYHERSLERAKDFSYDKIKEDWVSLIETSL